MLLVIDREVPVRGTEILLIHELFKMVSHERLCLFSRHVAPKLIRSPPGTSNDSDASSDNLAKGLLSRLCLSHRSPQFQEAFRSRRLLTGSAQKTADDCSTRAFQLAVH